MTQQYQSLSFWRPVQVTTSVMPVGVAYTGPGDIAPNALGWWGLRAYSQATVGHAVVQVQRQVDSARQNFYTMSNGYLNVTEITTFCQNQQGLVTALYDQSGHGLHLTETVSNAYPTFSLAIINGYPAINPANSLQYGITNTTGFGTIPQPFTISAVYQVHVNQPGVAAMIFGDSNHHGLVDSDPANTVGMWMNVSIPTAVATDNVFHSAQAMFNDPGATSRINVDTVTTSMTLNSTNSWAAGTIGIGDFANNVSLDGFYVEFGMWSSEFSDSTANSMVLNQRGFWGF